MSRTILGFGGGGGGGDPVTATTETIRVAKAGTPVEMNPMVAGDEVVGAHGLGVVPEIVKIYAECLTAEGDYEVGDRVHVQESSRITSSWDATNLTIAVGPTNNNLRLIPETGGGAFNVTLASWKLVGIAYVFEDKEVVTAVDGDAGDSDDSGGSGTALESIAELPELNADNFGWMWNLNGTLVENYAEPITTTTLDVGYATVGAGDTINLSGHANVRYRGAHYGSAAVANPQNNDIFLNLLGGHIQYYIHTAGDELTDGWRNATQALLDAMGYLGYRRHKRDANQLVAHASQTDKVGLYVGYGGLLRRVTSFTEETENNTAYLAREYRPHVAVGNPVAWYYGIGQTERFPSTYPNTSIDQDVSAVQFADPATDGTHEYYDGGDIAFRDMWVAPGDVPSDADTVDGNSPITNNMYFKPGEGRYDIAVYVKAETARSRNTIRVLKVASGNDEAVGLDRRELPVTINLWEFNLRDMVLTDDDVLWVGVFDVTENINAAMRIEKLA